MKKAAYNDVMLFNKTNDSLNICTYIMHVYLNFIYMWPHLSSLQKNHSPPFRPIISQRASFSKHLAPALHLCS